MEQSIEEPVTDKRHLVTFKRKNGTEAKFYANKTRSKQEKKESGESPTKEKTEDVPL